MKPEILSHPNIPKPLHGVNPRTILGKDWWDKKRFEAQARTGYTCSACGIHKSKAKKYQWLEGHEYWDINYKTGRCEVKSIEPLCHYCHNFIHSGRLGMILGKEKTKKEVIDILEYGFKILSKNKLKCFPYTLALAKSLGANTFKVKAYKNPKTSLEWGNWFMVLEGKEYKSNFNNIEDWHNFYQQKAN